MLNNAWIYITSFILCMLLLSNSKYFLCGHAANVAPKEGHLEEGKIQMFQASKNICKKIQLL